VATFAHDQRSGDGDFLTSGRLPAKIQRSAMSASQAPASCGASASSTAKSSAAAKPVAFAAPASASRSSVSPTLGEPARTATLRWRVSSRCPYSSQRSSSTGDTETCESEPMPHAPPASR
jgi:hypothetical protein